MLVRNGEDARLPPRDGADQHTLLPVYAEMYLQVCRDYASLPDPAGLTLSQIRFFFNGLRFELRAATKPRKK